MGFTAEVRPVEGRDRHALVGLVAPVDAQGVVVGPDRRAGATAPGLDRALLAYDVAELVVLDRGLQAPGVRRDRRVVLRPRLDRQAGGIAEALITTAGGLTVAIPALIFYRYFNRRIEGFVVSMESEALKLVEALHSEALPGAGPQI